MRTHSDLSASFRQETGLALFLYLAFVIYGSLVPWNFQPQPLDDAWQAFLAIPYLHLGIGSRADWVANILLFIPLGFLMLGFLWPQRGTLARLGVAVLVLLLCVLLSGAIEFTQIFFPPRTVSQNDIQAEAGGALLGILAWWWQGPALHRWLLGWLAGRAVTPLSERLLWLYLACLFGYHLLPLDLTISPVEIYHKWREGKVLLVPFTAPAADLAQEIYALAAEIALWVPVSFLLVLSGKKRPLAALTWTVLAALVLEGLQLLVYSRVTDSTDILTALAGAAMGVWLAGRVPGISLTPPGKSSTALFWLGLAGVAGWSVALAVVFWYPFHFVLERSWLQERLPLLFQMPFYHYYYGTEFRAVTEVLHKIVFFMPLGAALALMRQALPPAAGRRLFDVGAFLLMAGLALGIELGQIALPGKYPDSTDWLLETLGGVLGYKGALLVLPRLPQRTQGLPPRQEEARPLLTIPTARRYDWPDEL